MAKNEEKKAQNKEQAVVNEENVLDVLQKSNSMEDDSFDKAEAEIKDEEEKRKVRAAKEALLEARYTELKEVLQLQQRRAEDKATKKALENVKVALGELKDKKITPVQFKDRKREIGKAKREAFAEASKAYDKGYEELKSKFPNYYSFEWDRYDRW